jgi:hypothetical protein
MIVFSPRHEVTRALHQVLHIVIRDRKENVYISNESPTARMKGDPRTRTEIMRSLTPIKTTAGSRSRRSDVCDSKPYMLLWTGDAMDRCLSQSFTVLCYAPQGSTGTLILVRENGFKLRGWTLAGRAGFERTAEEGDGKGKAKDSTSRIGLRWRS